MTLQMTNSPTNPSSSHWNLQSSIRHRNSRRPARRFDEINDKGDESGKIEIRKRKCGIIKCLACKRVKHASYFSKVLWFLMSRWSEAHGPIVGVQTSLSSACTTHMPTLGSLKWKIWMSFVSSWWMHKMTNKWD